MARYQYRKSYKGYTDLRDLLDDKHQRGVEYNGPPHDPPSSLKDPLRGDVPHTNRYPRNEFYRGRGRYPRRPNYNRARGYSNTRGHQSRLPSNPTNIKVEFSFESGERKCQIESGNDISDRFHTTGSRDTTNMNRGRGNFRGRFRGYQPRRGNRGYYYSRRPRIDQDNAHSSESNQNDAQVHCEEENWDLPDEVAKEIQNVKVLEGDEKNQDELEDYPEEDHEYIEVPYVGGEYAEEENVEEENAEGENTEGENVEYENVKCENLEGFPLLVEGENVEGENLKRVNIEGDNIEKENIEREYEEEYIEGTGELIKESQSEVCDKNNVVTNLNDKDNKQQGNENNKKVEKPNELKDDDLKVTNKTEKETKIIIEDKPKSASEK